MPELIRYIILDKKEHTKKLPYGCWFFVGKQGSGKTMSLVYYLEKFKSQFPDVKIYTNFGYQNQTAPLQDIYDITDKTLYGEHGTIFAIDEIQNEFSCTATTKFPVEVLSTVTQQRKQQVLILCTSQVFTRVAKPLREQAFRVIECKTLFNRYTMCNHFDGFSYADTVDLSTETQERRRQDIAYNSFVQSDYLRSLYDTFEVIKLLKRGD